MTVVKSTDYVGQMYEEFRQNTGRQKLALIERFYLRYLTELACNRFKWSGFPEDEEGDIRVRYLELTLFRFSLAVFFRHDKETIPNLPKGGTHWDKFLALRGTQSGNLDMYYDPQQYHLYANGFTPGIDGVTIAADKCVPIWANYLRQPDLDLIQIMVPRLAQFDRTIDINVKTLRHPYLIAADETTRHSMENFYRQVDQGEPVVFVQGALADKMDEMVKVLDFKLNPAMISNLLTDKKKIWLECLSFLGIDNANQEKKERLVEAEVGANNSEVSMARKIAMDAREHACELINKKWNLNVKVEWNEDLDTDMPSAPGMETLDDDKEEK